MGIIPYVGKEGEKPEKGQTERVVLQLVEPYVDSGRTIITDRHYTAPSLAKALYAKGLNTVGTLKTNRQELPKQFVEISLQNLNKPKAKRGRKKKNQPTLEEIVDEVGSQQPAEGGDQPARKGMNAFVFRKNVTLVKYEPLKKTKKKDKNVHLLSTLHHTASVEVGGKEKAEIVNYYNGHKFGVDLSDQLVKYFTTRRTSNRWPMRLFFWALDIAAMQAFIVYRLANPDVAKDKNYRRKFMNALWEDLMRPQKAKRRANITPHQRKVNHLGYVLWKFKTGGKKQHSLSESAMKRTFEKVKKPAAIGAKRQLIFDGQQAGPAAKKVRSRGACYASMHETRKLSDHRCVDCDEWVCPVHRVDAGTRDGKKLYKCFNSISTPCIRGKK